MTEFLVIGRGLAAATLMHELHDAGLSFHVTGDPLLSPASRVAAGIWHPVVFKRMTLSWRADEFIPHLIDFYTACEKRLGSRFLTRRKLIRAFSEPQEEALWKKKAGEELKGFLDPEIYSNGNAYPFLRIPHTYGIVENAGNLDVKSFIESTEKYFASRITTGGFVHRELVISQSGFEYKGLKAKKIIFCEGHLVSRNPFFSWVPMRPAKGEVLTITFSRHLLQNEIFNRNGFLFDIGNGRYRAGATYEWERLQGGPTAEKLSELKEKVHAMTDCPYTVESHEAGIRPSSFDRRPVMGEHPAIRGMYVFNGLGTKGVMLAPWFAAKFVIFCRQGAPLDPDVDVGRFTRLYDAAQKA
jgi:glycine oxidase